MTKLIADETLDDLIEKRIQIAATQTKSDDEVVQIAWLADGIRVWFQTHGKRGNSPEEARRYIISSVTRLLANNQRQLLAKLLEQLPEKLDNELGEPHLFQGGTDDSAPFLCSACFMSEMQIIDNLEGDKYYCKCSFWSDPHNAYLDKSGGKWLGWKNKAAAQKTQDDLPTYENGTNETLDQVVSIINHYLTKEEKS